MNYLKQEK